MMDLSDGLAGDLRHVLQASRVGAELLATAIPISREARAGGQGRRRPPSRRCWLRLTDGEDFELLFTVASTQAVPLLDAWKNAVSRTAPDLHRQDHAGRGHRDSRQARACAR